MKQEFEETSRGKSLKNVATFLTAALIPIIILVSQTVGAIYKTNNPDNVDITNGLAYIQQTLIAGIGVGIVIALIIVWLIIRIYRRDKNFSEAKLPMLLLVFVGACVVAIAAISNYTSSVENQYLKDHDRPTLSEFFDKLEEQKKKK
jgi:glucan phosphoethanolaminetransferase (alkaline phosphatase superfamily)